MDYHTSITNSVGRTYYSSHWSKLHIAFTKLEQPRFKSVLNLSHMLFLHCCDAPVLAKNPSETSERTNTTIGNHKSLTNIC